MPTAASLTARPSLTSANANTSTHDTEKNSVVVRISRPFTSMAKSFRNTSSAVRRNTSAASDDAAIAGAKAGGDRFVGEQAAVADDRDARHETLGEIEIVGREDDDAAR